MTELEGLVREAIRSTADEIAPGSIPPLSLSSDERRQQAGPARLRQRHSSWARAAVPLAAAAAVIAVLAGVAMVTAGPPGRRSPAASTSPGRHHAAARSALSSGQLAGLDTGVIDEYVPATSAEYTTGNQFEAAIGVLQDTIAAGCMARSGFHIPAGPPAAAMAAQWYDNTQFPDLARISRTRSFGQASAGPGAPVPPKGASRRVFAADYARCGKAAQQVFMPLTMAGGRLGSPWLTIMTGIQSSAPVRALVPELRSCAARYGWPATPYGAPATAINSFADFANWVFGHVDGAGTRGGQPALATAERKWAPVFVACARPTFEVQDRLAAAQRAIFLRQHERQARAVQALARQLIGQAGKILSGSRQ